MLTALCALIAALAFGAASATAAAASVTTGADAHGSSTPGNPPAPWIPTIQPPQYFAVRVTDVDEAVAWYRTVFGLEGIGGSEAEDGRWRIENLRNDALFVEIVRDDRAQEAERALGFGKVGFFVPDLETVADRAEQATGERPRVLDFEQLHLRLLQLRDPDGNVIQVHEQGE